MSHISWSLGESCCHPDEKFAEHGNVATITQQLQTIHKMYQYIAPILVLLHMRFPMHTSSLSKQNNAGLPQWR